MDIIKNENFNKKSDKNINQREEKKQAKTNFKIKYRNDKISSKNKLLFLLLIYYIYIECNNNSYKKLNSPKTQISSRNSNNKKNLIFPILNPSNSYGNIIPFVPYKDKYHSILNNYYHIENIPVLIPNILSYKLKDKKIKFNSNNRYNNNYLYKNKSCNDINENNNNNKNKSKIISRKSNLKNFSKKIFNSSLIEDEYYPLNNYNFIISNDYNDNDYIKFIENTPKLNHYSFINDIINNEDNNNKRIMNLKYNDDKQDLINEMYKMNYNLNNRLNQIVNIQMDNQKTIDFLLNRLNDSFYLRKLDPIFMSREYAKEKESPKKEKSLKISKINFFSVFEKKVRKEKKKNNLKNQEEQKNKYKKSNIESYQDKKEKNKKKKDNQKEDDDKKKDDEGKEDEKEKKQKKESNNIKENKSKEENNKIKLQKPLGLYHRLCGGYNTRKYNVNRNMLYRNLEDN